MPDRPTRSHYNDHSPGGFSPSIAAMNADTRSSIADPNDTPRFIIGSWLVRVAFMAVAIWLVNYAFGPFGWSWAALVAYAIMSLALNLAPSRLKDS